MAFRISESEAGGEHVVRVDGDLNAESAGMLRQLLASNGGTKIALDLSQVRSTDRDGAEFLLEAEQLGLELRRASPFLELLIERGREGQAT